MGWSIQPSFVKIRDFGLSPNFNLIWTQSVKKCPILGTAWILTKSVKTWKNGRTYLISTLASKLPLLSLFLRFFLKSRVEATLTQSSRACKEPFRPKRVIISCQKQMRSLSFMPQPFSWQRRIHNFFGNSISKNRPSTITKELLSLQEDMTEEEEKKGTFTQIASIIWKSCHKSRSIWIRIRHAKTMFWSKRRSFLSSKENENLPLFAFFLIVLARKSALYQRKHSSCQTWRRSWSFPLLPWWWWCWWSGSRFKRRDVYQKR